MVEEAKMVDIKDSTLKPPSWVSCDVDLTFLIDFSVSFSANAIVLALMHFAPVLPQVLVRSRPSYTWPPKLDIKKSRTKTSLTRT